MNKFSLGISIIVFMLSINSVSFGMEQPVTYNLFEPLPYDFQLDSLNHIDHFDRRNLAQTSESNKELVEAYRETKAQEYLRAMHSGKKELVVAPDVMKFEAFPSCVGHNGNIVWDFLDCSFFKQNDVGYQKQLKKQKRNHPRFNNSFIFDNSTNVLFVAVHRIFLLGDEQERLERYFRLLPTVAMNTRNNLNISEKTIALLRRNQLVLPFKIAAHKNKNNICSLILIRVNKELSLETRADFYFNILQLLKITNKNEIYTQTFQALSSDDLIVPIKCTVDYDCAQRTKIMQTFLDVMLKNNRFDEADIEYVRQRGAITFQEYQEKQQQGLNNNQ